MRKQICFLLLIFFSVTAFAQNSLNKQNTAANKTLVSKNLKISVNKDTGNFIFYAKESIGTPDNENKSSDWVKILSEKIIPSSYFMFLKDGISIGYGTDEKGIHTCQIKWNEIRYAWENADTRIISTFSFLQNRKTSSYDGFNINLNIRNISEKDIELAAIACFDGNSDSLEEHYFTSNRRISNEQELIGSNIKDFVIINTIIAQTALKLFVPDIISHESSKKISPKRIFFTNWRRMKDHKSGNFNVNTGRLFNTEPYSDNDSALFIEYPNTKISPNEHIEINFKLNIENSKISAGSQATLDELFMLLNEINQKLNNNEIVEKKYLNDLDDRIDILK